MKKILLTLILGIFLLSFASSQIQSLGTFKLNADINLIQTCDNCTFNNITSVLYPNSSVAISNVEMTKDGTFYNHTFSNANITGSYIVNGFGDLDGINTVWNYDFKVNNTGTEQSISDAILYIISFVGLIIVFFLSLYFAISLPYRNIPNDDGQIISVSSLKYLKLMMILISYALFNWVLNLLMALSELLNLTSY
ncbi:hypothetical protein LCGC14_2916540, partial [marine sediment metagenome]